MDFDGLVEQVRRETGLESAAEAEAGLDTALERLGERLTAEEADALASRLPPTAAAMLHRRVGRENPSDGMATLAEEVAAADGVAPAEGVRLVRATLRAVAVAVAPQALPPALAALLAETGKR